MHYLYVWKTGKVEIGESVPDGAVLIAKSKNISDFDDHLVCCREMYDGSHVIGTVFDAYRAEQAKTGRERRMATIACCYPDDTPAQALSRWLEWRGITEAA